MLIRNHLAGLVAKATLTATIGFVLAGCESASVECEFNFECEELEACVAGLCVPPCEAGEYVSDGACEPCGEGMTSVPDQPRYGDDTTCFAILCGENERVSGHTCVACGVGRTNDAEDDATGDDTACEPLLCSEDEHVVSNACVPCPSGLGNEAGDDASGEDTVCDEQACPSNQHVVDHACEACEPGTERAAGDDPSGGDTECEAVFCGENHHVVAHTCVACHDGTQRSPGDDASAGDTACTPILCDVDQHVVGHRCLACEAGSTRAAGDDATGDDTVCEPVICAENESVSDNRCVPCVAGSYRPGGDLATEDDTECEATICGVDEHVAAHACVACAAGTVRDAGDDASGDDTACEVVLCDENEHVVSHRCETCPAGATNAAGDNASAGDTPCDASRCASDYHVSDHACVACPAGTTNEAGDDAAGDNTACASIACGLNERVDDNRCVPCAAGTVNDAGDLADAGDTSCEPVFCGSDEHVLVHSCEPCPAGTTNGAGDDASQSNTACDPILCDVDERVEANACIACPGGTINDGGDDASGADTACDHIYCDEDEHVLDHLCVACPDEWFNEAGDDASGGDTACFDACYAALGVLCDDLTEAYVKASNTDERDSFGWSVAVSGETIVVGTPFEDSASRGVGGTQSDNSLRHAGAVYVFVREGGTWTQQAYIKASRPQEDAEFGHSVDIAGDTLVVGAPGESTGDAGVNANEYSGEATNSGAVYVFVRSGGVWLQQAFVKAPQPDAYDAFGWSVAIDSDLLVVGAPNEDGSATSTNGDQSSNDALDAGAAYVLRRDGLSWAYEAYLKASNAEANDSFGEAVAISNLTIVVGAPDEDGGGAGVGSDGEDNSVRDAGAAYIFHHDDGWTQLAYLKAEAPDTDDDFGATVAIDGNLALVGARREDGGNPVNPLDNSLTDSGCVYAYRFDGLHWSLFAYLKPPNPLESLWFGHAIGISNDLVAIGAHQDPSFGTGPNADEFSDSGARSGAVHLFRLNSSRLDRVLYLKSWNPGPDAFAWALALDSGLLVVGAPEEDSAEVGVNPLDLNDNSATNAGATYVYRVAH